MWEWLELPRATDLLSNNNQLLKKKKKLKQSAKCAWSLPLQTTSLRLVTGTQ